MERRNLTDAEVENTLRTLSVSVHSAPSQIGCYITDSSGAATTTVTAASYPSGPFYWLHYSANGLVSNIVKFIVLPAFAGSPLAIQTQSFSPQSNSNIETPFGIPFWGNNLTSGPWVLAVESDAGQTVVCSFTVTP